MSCGTMLFYWNILIVAVFVCHSGLSLSTIPSAPPADFPTDNSTYIVYPSPKISETPPHVFPENDSNYKVIKNMTIVKDLISHSSNKNTQNYSNIDTEVPSLISPALVHKITNDSAQNSSMQPKIKDKKVEGSDSDLNQEQVDLSNTAVSKNKIHQEHDHKVRGTGPILQGQLAAVLAGVFALIAIASYIGLLTWRRYLEHRYGNRELLINENDHINYNDMKNFEL